MSSSVMGFSGTADLMVKLSVFENPRWRLMAVLKKFERPYLCNKSSDPLHVWFWYRFSGSADRMAPLPIGPNLIWWLAAMLSWNSKWHNSGSTQDRDVMSSSVLELLGTADLMVKFLVSRNPWWRLVDILKWLLIHAQFLVLGWGFRVWWI